MYAFFISQYFQVRERNYKLLYVGVLVSAYGYY